MTQKNLMWHHHSIQRKAHANQKTQKPFLIWFTGLSGAGKSTIANALEVALFEQNRHTYLLDGDNVRLGLNKDLGFSEKDRVENIRRIGEVSKLMVDAGLIVLSAFISPLASDRMIVRNLFQSGEFVEIYVNTPLSVCEERDTKGLYKKARENVITNFTGISSPYEPPTEPEIQVDTHGEIEESVNTILSYLGEKGYLLNDR